jgi:MFS family permease
MMRGIGITNQKTQLLYNGAQNVVSFGGAIFGAVFTDRLGRRRQLMFSLTAIVVFFTLITVLNATNLTPDPRQPSRLLAKSPDQAKAIIAIIFMFGFVFGAGFTPLQALYPVECLRYESRAKGMGMYNFFVNIANFYNTFVTEIAFNAAGWKYYLLFVFWDTFEILFIYFLFVETRHRTLEELNEIFAARNPVKASLEKREYYPHSNETSRSQSKRATLG